MDEPMLDDALELLADFNERLSALENRPPPLEWAHTVTFLVDRYATRKTAIGLATTLAAVYAIIQGVPGV